MVGKMKGIESALCDYDVGGDEAEWCWRAGGRKERRGSTAGWAYDFPLKDLAEAEAELLPFAEAERPRAEAANRGS